MSVEVIWFSYDVANVASARTTELLLLLAMISLAVWAIIFTTMIARFVARGLYAYRIRREKKKLKAT